jgi:hypothetical protein
MSKPKLIIHETDCHGCGFIHYKDTTEAYHYDDGSWGDVKETVKKLIDIGFINKDDVAIFDNSYDIYKIVEKGLMNNEN